MVHVYNGSCPTLESFARDVAVFEEELLQLQQGEGLKKILHSGETAGFCGWVSEALPLSRLQAISLCRNSGGRLTLRSIVFNNADGEINSAGDIGRRPFNFFSTQQVSRFDGRY